LRSSEDWLRSLRTAQGLSEDFQGLRSGQGLPAKAQGVLKDSKGLVLEGLYSLRNPEGLWQESTTGFIFTASSIQV